ncbi:1,2-dihydroxy-3-keto-5-methylthiopentene dioxygenase [Tirmania nivea]|nr:1,2-dihydroxy-3-keto-5-methylthiopentene dioxygenase [Tirmania nivea]
MRAYLYDNLEGDQRLPHDSGVAVNAATLSRMGVFLQRIPPGDIDALNAVATSRAYRNRDEITFSPAALGAAEYDAKLRMFFEEHLHEEEEIRWIIDGCGYFDMRDERAAGAWIRIEVVTGDLIELPAGAYHRFTSAESNYIKSVRLYKDKPNWTPFKRSEEVDKSAQRKMYLEALAEGVSV